ncbi:hypothetical protein M1403_00780 [Patescibacteria group bacterium]|nr:hypothetical protein [Patescibacteria group bacterium]
MRKKAAICLALIFCGLIFVSPVRAVYDPLSVPNNKFGIHILDPQEIFKAADLVNTSGGQWGYVTIPIRANDRDLEKWTKFMQNAKQLKIIPILRIASFPVDDHWMAPNEYDLVDFANFLDQLPWPTRNRYVVIYNEPNHEGEWGGFVYPQEYARVLDRAVDIFHKRNPDFFVISAGMDASAPNGSNSMNEYEYFSEMQAAWPGIFSRIDGFSSHAYGNPGFSTYPNVYSPVNVASYRFERDYLCHNFEACNLKIFITEAGWKNGGWLKAAFDDIWTDDDIVAVTPFLLDAQTQPFADFSFTGTNGLKPFAKEYMAISKAAGNPQLAAKISQISQGYQVNPGSGKIYPQWTGNLPQMLNDALIGSWIAKFLAMLTGPK